jgi:phage recombination protein Bet
MRPIIPRTELTPITSLPALYNPRDLALIRRTVAHDTTDDEFALFIHWARSLRLDPLRRQVHAFVFHKHDPKKRRLSLVTSIEGFRAIAARTGNYRPDENEPAFIADDTLKSDTNPAGLVSCAVRVWQYAHGQWFPITGMARWEEFAPLKTVWVDNQPTDRKVLDKSGRWADMPFLMLAKCAEAQAIRKGWPEDLSNTFVGEEIEQAALTLNPAQAAAAPHTVRNSMAVSRLRARALKVCTAFALS